MDIYAYILNICTTSRSDENKVQDDEPVPDTVLSDSDLDARIAALGLGTEGGVEDKSTCEDPMEKLRPIERVQKEVSLPLSLSLDL